MTNVLSDVAVEVDGMPRHVSNVRLQCPAEAGTGESQGESSGNSGCAQEENVPSVRPARVHRPPAWLRDYVG